MLAGEGDTWERKTLFAYSGRNGHGALDSGDIDGDGHLDIAMLTGDGRVRLFLGDSTGNFAEENSPELPQEISLGCAGYDLILRDLNGDGRAEIVASFAGEKTGFPGIPDLNMPGCPSGGSIKAWSPSPKG
jgi:hypothetical protein